MATLTGPEVSTHIYKSIDGLDLTLDVFQPRGESASESASVPKVALIHYHGGFLVIGQKTTFPPSWLINACLRRGWTYITPSYRLLPESTGEDVIADAIDAAAWVASNLTKRLVVAGSSAGGFLSLSVATRMTAPRPLAMLSIYGMLDMTSSRYVEPGTTLMENPLIHNAGSLLQEMDAMKGTSALDGYPFPQNPLTDKRMSWIAAAHQEATYPDLITGYPGLAAMIRKNGVDSIPLKYRQLFPVAFGLRADLPPVALLHGDQDTAVGYEQSIQCAKALAGFGVSVACEIVPGKGHGFDVMEISPDVDIEHQTADGDLVYQQLRNILNFIDSTTN